MSVFYNNLEQTLVSLHNVFENVSVLIDYQIKIQGFFQVFMKKTFVFQGILGLESKIQKFKDFQVFQGAYEPCLP